MGTSQKSMVSGWALLITFLVVSDLGCWAEATAEEGIDDNQTEREEVQHQHPWLGSLLGLTRRDLRADKEDMFWAIRGKRQYIKPNGFFQANATPTPGKRSMDFWRTGKRSLKPNGLFGSMKRASLKPNSLFASYKRTGLRPNGLFGSLKRANLGLKPNGLFGAYKRAGLKPNGLFGAYKRPSLKPNGLFGAYKRAQVPTGLWVPTQFGWEEIDDDNEEIMDDEDQEQEYFNYVEDDISYDDDEMDLEEPQAEKREDAEFWAARGKKEDADFWATRG